MMRTNGRAGVLSHLSKVSRRQTKRKGKPVASLTERTYQLLRRDILSCVLEPGSEISEADVAERLAVSKTPVREALGRLRVEGFVKTFPRRGYQIVRTKRSPELVRRGTGGTVPRVGAVWKRRSRSWQPS